MKRSSTLIAYSKHPQPMHSHTSQLQVSPLQFGHLQTSQPQPAAFVDACAAQHAPVEVAVIAFA